MRETPLAALTPGWVRASPWLVPIALVAVVVPLALGFAGATAPDVIKPGLSAARLLRLSTNSIQLAAGTCVMALLLAVPVALVCRRLSSPRAGAVLLAFAVLPLFLSPTVLAVAAVRLFGPAGLLTKLLTGDEATFPVTEQIFGPPPDLPGAPIYTVWGAAFVLAWWLAPLATLALWSVLPSRPEAWETEALLHTSPVGVLARLTLPSAGAGIAAGVVLVLLFAITDLAVAEALRSLPVLVAEVYVQFGVFYDPRAAVAAAGVVVGLVIAVMLVASWLMRGRPLIPVRESSEESPAPFPAAVRRGFGARVLTMVGVVAAVLPGLAAVGILWYTVRGPDGPGVVWKHTWNTAHQELFLSLVLGGITAALAIVVGSAMGAGLACRRNPGAWRLMMLVPLLVPAPAWGIAGQVILRRPPGSLPLGLDDRLADLSATWIPVLVVWTVRLAPLVALLVEASLRRLPTDVLDAARLDGPGPLAFARRVVLPVAWRAMAAGGACAFALSLGEIGAAVLLAPPGVTTLGVRLMTLMHYAPTGEVSALSLFVVLPGLLAWLTAVAVMGLGARPSARSAGRYCELP